MPKKLIQISTRGYYDLTNARKRKNLMYSVSPKKKLQELYRTKELVIMIHGLRNDRFDARKKFLIAQRRLKQLGYRYPVIGFSYDSNTKGAHLKKSALRALRVGQKIALQNGYNLSKFILDFKKQSPNTKIRLLGHSLGTELIMSTLRQLYNYSNQNIIESVHFFGSSIPNESIITKQYEKIFENVVRNKIKNYYSKLDKVLMESHQDNWIKNPIGCFATTKRVSSNFRHIHITPKNHRFASYADKLKSFP